MKIIAKTLKSVNPEQKPIVTADQPVYALAKQIQWQYPNVFGEDRMIVMMSDLHTEMATMAMIGDWLEGSEWANLFVAAGISTPGTCDVYLKGHNVKHCRYAHQVSVAALYYLLKKIWEEQTASSETTFSDWITERRAKCSQFDYCYTVIKLEALLLLFVRSIREANFKQYHQCLKQIVPCMFSMDHTHYARWLPVFL